MRTGRAKTMAAFLGITPSSPAYSRQQQTFKRNAKYQPNVSEPHGFLTVTLYYLPSSFIESIPSCPFGARIWISRIKMGKTLMTVVSCISFTTGYH